MGMEALEAKSEELYNWLGNWQISLKVRKCGILSKRRNKPSQNNQLHKVGLDEKFGCR